MIVSNIPNELFPEKIRSELEGINIYLVSENEVKKIPPVSKAMIAFVVKCDKAIFLIDEHVADMSDDALSMIVLHEVCHIKHPDASEDECDEYGINIMGEAAFHDAMAYTKSLQKKLMEKPHDESEDKYYEAS